MMDIEKLNKIRGKIDEAAEEIVMAVKGCLAIDEESLSDEAIKGIEEALEDIKHGHLHSEGEVMEEFDLK